MPPVTALYAIVLSDSQPDGVEFPGSYQQTREEGKSPTHSITRMVVYQATDNEKPEWFTTYEYGIDVGLLPADSKSQSGSFSELTNGEALYDLVSLRQAPGVEFHLSKPGDVELVAVSMTLKDVENAEVQFDKWYEQEHTDLLSKVPGWLRTRRFKTSHFAMDKEATYLALHEYEWKNGLGGEAHLAAMSTNWRNEIMQIYVKDKSRRTYQLQEDLGRHDNI
ncbi:hypothetical protein OIDMADRAFT_56356 [Oidiodendron maius Zn]|uniref:ABM domain-containing protein n=1 Tax=Oidiodendron maius (strain Zn) TaxID=913774 RepID=A0A0C3HA24_OIDMZ|nr:hypothetical protein OIDMADRAFT_56356 [Oidiodendron maius Zn]